MSEFTRDTLHRELSRSQGGLTTRTEYDPLDRRISKTRQPLVQGRLGGKAVTTRLFYLIQTLVRSFILEQMAAIKFTLS
ncbi:hypothetical protein HA50_12205 [Pantoea cypripedii]|uniref:Uncharacterized protein n=1 Tax=Pantoea cypripedii TaxID=55209 RepID=A0A1X1EW02_PANCY|nr:YD repeat-containing protein [Pantoea cypripedii]ORM94074.1 hypothetical protein HA50_12205 [Pantoea cypripedii]